MIRKAFLTLSVFALSFFVITVHTHAAEVIEHKIKWGDTLSQIALDYDVSVNDLVDLNQIDHPDFIYAGDILTIKQYENLNVEEQDVSSHNSDTREEAYDNMILESVTEKFKAYEFKY